MTHPFPNYLKLQMVIAVILVPILKSIPVDDYDGDFRVMRDE